MNSIIQCLSHLVPFREALISHSLYQINRSSQLQGKLAEAFISLLQQMKNSVKGDVLSPGEVKYQMGKFSDQFKGSEQNDSSEFFRALLDALGQDLSRLGKKASYREMTGSLSENVSSIANRWWDYSLSRDNSIVTDLFQGQFVSNIKCGLCNYISVTCDCFLSLNLPSTEKTSFSYELEESLDQYFSDHSIETYKCEKCKKSSKSRQQLSIYRFPKIMALQLKRFKANAVSRTRLNNEVQLKETLNLSKYRHPQGETASLYHLKAISHHRGSLYSGHYISECKEENTWFCFDDSRVTETLTPSSSSSAYLLFYVSV
jgi:ubiquitin C-terminal hydrolase